MNKLFFVLIVLTITNCAAKESLINSEQPELQIITFDVVKKKLIVDQEIPNHLNIILTKWFNDKVKINGFNGDMTFSITNFTQETSLINEGKRVDASLSFKLILNKPLLSKRKVIEGTVSSYGTLTGDFSLSEFDIIIQNTQSDLIFRLSRDLKSNI